jgi:hypothetical protein
MSSGSGAFGVNGGYSQSAGGYYITTASIQSQFLTYTGGSGSGGATSVGNFGAYYAPAGENFSTLINASGKLIRDMGVRVVSAGRTFRKFQAVRTDAGLSTGGVVGAGAGTVNPGYITGYIEVGSPYTLGPNGMTVPTIARFA